MGRRKINILLLGIGNILFQDEGIGAHFIHYIDENYEFESNSATLSIIDGGTLAHRLIPEIVKYDELIVVDCVEADNSQVGDVYFFDYKKVPSFINWQGSAHEIEMLQTLNMIDMNGDLPNSYVLGIIPKRVADDTTFELSPEVIKAVNVMENALIKHLKSLDIKANKIQNKTIEQIAQISFKREMKNAPLL